MAFYLYRADLEFIFPGHYADQLKHIHYKVSRKVGDIKQYYMMVTMSVCLSNNIIYYMLNDIIL